MKKIEDEANEIFDKIQADFGINDAPGVLLLNTAKECFIKIRECDKILKKEGNILSDKFGQKIVHPATRLQTSARAQMLTALKALDLEIAGQEKQGPGRPGFTL